MCSNQCNKYLIFKQVDSKESKRNLIARYKIQPGTNSPLSKGRFLELLRLVVFNQIVVGGVTQYVFYYLHKNLHNITSSSIVTLPSLLRVLLELSFFILIEEILFFYVHWALHRSYYRANPFLKTTTPHVTYQCLLGKYSIIFLIVQSLTNIPFF